MAVGTTKRSYDKMSLFSAPGSVLIKTTFMKSLPDAPDCVLVKTSTDNSRWQTGEMLRGSKFLEPIHFLVLHETPPGANRPLHMVSAFPGKYASITAVDLIQLNKLDSRNFYESNLTEARFEIILFSTVLLE